MSVLLGYSVHRDGTRLITYPNLPERSPDAWRAICAWCEAHGMDPHKMPATNRIVRNVELRRVEFDALVLDDDGRIVLTDRDVAAVCRSFAQGETPPMPFPDVVLEGAS